MRTQYQMPSDPVSSAPTTAGLLPPGLEPDLGLFYHAWLGLRRGALVPSLRDYLDAPPFRLQPFVAILDIHSPEFITVRLFGTALTAIAGQEFTKKDLSPIYAAQELGRAGEIVWDAVTHPAGYICVRTVRTGHGLVLDCDCISLPLVVDAGAPKCLVTFVRFPQQTPRTPKPEMTGVVTRIRFVDWIDIGAGKPALPAADRRDIKSPPGF